MDVFVLSFQLFQTLILKDSCRQSLHKVVFGKLSMMNSKLMLFCLGVWWIRVLEQFSLSVCTLLLLPVLLIHDFDSVGMNIYPSGNKLLGGSAKKSEGVENKLSISDICKRRLVDQESEARALPLSAWDTQEPEIDCADWSCVCW